jgi:hypothetical protein
MTAKKRIKMLRAYYEQAVAYSDRNPGTPSWIARAAARRLRLALWVVGRVAEARAVMLVALALLAVACASPAPEPPPGWALADVVSVPTEAPCYVVSVAALAGQRDLPAGTPDRVRIARAGVDEAPGGWSARAWPGSDAYVYTMAGADPAVVVLPMAEACE